MEVKGRLFCKCMLLVILFTGPLARAQSRVHTYTIKDGQEYIILGTRIKKETLDSFMAQYNLNAIGLQQFFRTQRMDSLEKFGWELKRNKRGEYIITKPLLSSSIIGNPAGQIILTEKHPTLSELFPAVNNGISYGYNRFRRKYPFAVKDGTVTFFLRGVNEARKVYLAGSFNLWRTNTLPMQPTDSGWTVNVKLSPGKYWYKFIVDNDWIVDDDNRTAENDGLGNTNSVFYVPNTVFVLNGFNNARRVYLSGSFNNWRYDQLAMDQTATGWTLPMYLAEGTHTYRFIVDGQWMADPNNPERYPNEYNDFNSVIRLGNPYPFELGGYPDARKVVLSGSFNNWRNNELYMRKTNDGWKLQYTLGPGNYEYHFLVDGRPVRDPKNPLVMQDKKNRPANSYLIIDPNYTFRLKGHPGASQVFLAGDFNNWNENSLQMKREGDDWVFSVHLSAGKHIYKFIVDGDWIKDPGNALWEQNEQGTGNSVIWTNK